MFRTSDIETFVEMRWVLLKLKCEMDLTEKQVAGVLSLDQCLLLVTGVVLSLSRSIFPQLYRCLLDHGIRLFPCCGLAPRARGLVRVYTTGLGSSSRLTDSAVKGLHWQLCHLC